MGNYAMASQVPAQDPKEQKEKFELITLADLQQKFTRLKPLNTLVSSHPLYQIKDLRTLICDYISLTYQVTLETEYLALRRNYGPEPDKPDCANIEAIMIRGNCIVARTVKTHACDFFRWCKHGWNKRHFSWKLTDGPYLSHEVFYKDTDKQVQNDPPNATVQQLTATNSNGINATVLTNTEDPKQRVFLHMVMVTVSLSYMLKNAFENRDQTAQQASWWQHLRNALCCSRPRKEKTS